ncbi:MAG: AMP-binding protein [Kofleriaceae bacterium]
MSALALILDAAARFPDHVAIEEPAAAMTYRQLLALARHHAARSAAAVEVLDAERTTDFIARCLGAWLAGRAFLPIDPAEPATRRQAMVRRLGQDTGGDPLAYVIATSGSSGQPKLVRIAHRGVPALLRAQIAAFQLAPGARSLWLHAPIFDASVSDWGTAVASGATLVIPTPDVLATPAALRDELARRAVTHVDLPPALLPYLADPPPDLRVVILGGEPCPVERVRALARRLRVVIVYGPTEATVCSSLVVAHPERWSFPAIGEPLPGVRYEVVDGELWIAGEALALGYAGDPEETARRFVIRGGERWYRTGDRIEIIGNELVFAGRVDRQYKLAGRRVELEEIEATLARMPGVREAATAVRELAGSTRRVLVAFVDGDVTEAAVRAWIAAEGPVWVTPARVVVGSLPRTRTGKIDRGVLDQCAVDPVPISPASPLEHEVAAIWSRLGLALPEREIRFRDAGGDSLTALAFHAAVAAHGIALDPGVLARDPTFAELVAEAQRGQASWLLDVAECEERGLEEHALRARPISGLSCSGPRLVLPLELDRARPAAPGAGGVVLVTGATGRFGPHLLRALRARDPRRIVALVRAPDEAAARLRLGALADEVEVLCGDVGADLLGLRSPRWCRLVEDTTAIVHAAAKLELGGDWDAHADANVGGTAEIARMVAAKPEIAWHHISTLSVFVQTDRAEGRHATTAVPSRDARVFGGYAQTKVAAEAIARAHGASTILRLGLLVDDSSHTLDQLGMTLRGLAKLGQVPAGASALRLDVTLIEHAAAATVALALHGAAPAIHHIASAGVAFGELVRAVRVHAAPLEEVSPATFVETALARLADPEIAMAYLALGRLHGGDRMRPFDLFLATGADFATETTDRTLAALGIAKPVIDDARIDRLVGAALGSDFVDTRRA